MIVQQTHPKKEDSNRVKVIVSPVGRQGRPGTPGISIRFFDTLQEALDLQPRPENGVTFQVREETDPENFGFYVFDDREPEGYRYLGERWDDEYLTQIEDRIDTFEQEVGSRVEGLDTRVENIETDVTEFKTEVEERVEGVEQDVEGFKTEVNQRVDEVEDIVVGIGSGEGGKAYDSLADALAADIPDNVIFQTPEGIWRRDSTVTEPVAGAVFLRGFPNFIEAAAGEFELEQGGISSVTGEEVDTLDRVRTTLFLGGGRFEVNPEYAIYWAGYYDENGNFLRSDGPQYNNREYLEVRTNEWVRLVFSTAGAEGDLSPTDPIIKKKATGFELKSLNETRSAYVVNGGEFNIDLTNNIIEVGSDCYLLVGDKYLHPPEAVLDMATVEGSTKFIVFNIVSNEVELTGMSLEGVFEHNLYLIGYVRGGSIRHINGSYRVNGKLIDLSKIGETEQGGREIMTQTHVIDGEYFLLDTANSTITIPQTMYVIYNNNYWSVPAHVIDFSDVSGTTKFIFFNPSTLKFIVTSESVGAPIDMDYSFVGYIRRLNVHINGNYTVNGVYINGRGQTEDPTPDPGEEVGRDVLAISTRYAYDGVVDTLPENVGDVYGAYDSLVEDFPQYVTKEVLGKSRATIKMNVDATNILPFSIAVNSTNNLSLGMTVVIEGQEFEVAEIAENTTPSIGDHILLIPATTSDIYHMGSIMSLEGDELATYSRRWIRFEGLINQDPNLRVFISYADHDNLSVEGVMYGTQTPPTSGTLTYGNEFSVNFSNLSESEGDDINCYTFNFSNRRDESEIKNTLFFIGGVHGIERKARLGHMTFFNDLCRNWRGSEELEALRNIRYIVIPVVNPWGIGKVRNHNAAGVDLNRNSEKDFPYTSPLYYRWSGPSPESEPETVLVNTKLKENLNTVFAFLDSHNDGSMLGGLMMTEHADVKLGNALSRNINTNINRLYPDIPTFMYGWRSGSNTVWSLKQNPTVGDSVYGSNQNLNNPKTIDSVAGEDIIVEGETYVRNDSYDANYTNLYNTLPHSPTGSFARQASSFGVDQSFVTEVGGDYFMTSEEARKLQIDITGNVIATIAKGLLF